MDFDGARRAYVEWIVGAKRFDRAREGRRDIGIDTSWSMKELHSGGTFNGRHDARVATRRAHGRFLLHLTHRDADAHGVLWHTVVELVDLGDTVKVSHAAARSGPPGAYLRPKTGAPSVLRRLLKWNGHAVEPPNIGDASPIRVDSEAAGQAFRHLVLATERTTPLVVMTPRFEDGQFLAPPTALAHRLAGMCRVLQLTDDDAARAFTSELQDAGFPRQFATMDGAVRLFLPSTDAGDSPYHHRLWTRARIEGFDGDTTDTLAGEIAERAVRGTIPHGFFEIVERYDLTEAQRQVQKVLVEVPDATAAEDLAKLRQEHAVLREELKNTARRLEDLAATKKEVEEAHFADLLAKDEIEQARDELADALRAEQAKSSALKAALGAKQGSANADETDDEDRVALRAVMVGNPTPQQCLRALEIIFGDRVVVLPSAYSSARDASDFKHGRTLWELLENLATTYFKQMSEGSGGDAVARTVFGGKFAAKESETTMGNDKAKKARTFTYERTSYVMWRHLKIGVADTTVESVRVHFEWLGDRQILLVGHCGEHLYLPLY